MLRSFLLALSFCWWGLKGIEAAPIVTKFEPPNWWVPSARRTLLLLCYGRDLASAQVFTSNPHLTVLQVRSSADGSYLFIWLHLSPKTLPRIYPLIIRTPKGEVILPFPLHPRPATSTMGKGLPKSTVIYLLMPDRFCNGDPGNDDPMKLGTYDRTNPRAYHGGDLEGIRVKLPYLKELGANAIWLTPIYDNDDASPDEYHSYHPVDFFAVDEHFGTLETYRTLVRDAHRLGIRVVQDHVLNHCGPKHKWVHNPPTPTWFHPRAPADYRLRLLLFPETPLALKRRITDGWLFGFLPDLNHNDPLVAEYLIQHSLWWLIATGADAVRLDTAPYLPRPFLAQWRRALCQELPQVTVIGEVLSVPPSPHLQSFFHGGRKGYDGVDTGLNSVFDFALMRAIREVFGQDAPERHLREVLELDRLYPAPHNLVTLLGNHDVPRFATTARSDRKMQRLMLAALFLVTTRGSVQWYYGDEIGMEGGHDPDNRRDFPGGFPGDERNKFSPADRTAEENVLWTTLQSLFRLRLSFPWLSYAPIRWLRTSDGIIAYERWHGSLRLLVAINKSEQSVSLPMPKGKVQTLFGDPKVQLLGRQRWLTVKPWSGVIVSIQQR